MSVLFIRFLVASSYEILFYTLLSRYLDLQQKEYSNLTVQAEH